MGTRNISELSSDSAGSAEKGLSQQEGRSQIPTATFPLLSVLRGVGVGVRCGGGEAGQEKVGDGDVLASRHIEINISTQPRGIFGSLLH